MSSPAVIAGSRPAVAVKRVALWIVFVAALAAGVAAVAFGIAGMVQSLSTGLSTVVLLPSRGAQIFNVNDKYGTVHIVNGQFSYSSVVVRGLPGSIVAYIVVAAVATILTEFALCAVIATLAWRMLNHRPFRRSMTLSVGAAGVILIVGGLLSQAATSLAGSATASVLNRNDHTFWPVAGRFDPTWIVFGVVLLLVALAFEYGERLQSDSDGLV